MAQRLARKREVFSWFLLIAAVAAGLEAAGGCAGGSGGGSPIPPGPGQGLLRGKAPSAAAGVSNPERMTDGIGVEPGSFWRTEVTSVIDAGGFATYDLGQVATIHCALVEGDNNDNYRLSASEDGTNFTPIWVAPAVPGAGMRFRYKNDLAATARFVRLTADGGDGAYSVGELAVFAECPAEWPPTLSLVSGTPLGETAQFRLWLFGAAAIAFLLIHKRGSRDFARLLIVVPIGLGLSAAASLASLWPVEEPEQFVLRTVVAAIALVAVVREWRGRGKWAVDRRLITGILCLLSVVSVMCFYHLGMPQFRDNSKHRRTLVHPWDMRVYFPVAKYFRELRFDGLYLASVAAYLDNNNVPPERIARVRLRDLRDNHMRTVSDLVDEIQGVRKRFTPERWDEFKKDMRYFQDVMGGGDYLGSLQDHGGNATPVWIMQAYFLFRHAPASEMTLTLAGLIDPLLLIITFIVIGRTFGLRAMLMTMIMFGVTDYSRFGTNVMGSTLRQDWMCGMALAACAFKRRRYALGGGLVAYAGLIRAFPALAAFMMCAPGIWWVIETVRGEKKLPGWAALREALRPTLKAIAGGVGTMVALVALSSAMFGLSASWGTWLTKIRLHAEKPNTNHVGLRNVLAFDPNRIGQRVVDNRQVESWATWQREQLERFESRKPVFYVGVLAFTALAFAACRRRRLDQAALAGLMLIPIFFYPANYYCHFVWLLPLIGTRDRQPREEPVGDWLFAYVSAVLLAMTVAQYPTLFTGWSDVVYTWQSVILLVGFAAILGGLAWDAWRGRGAQASINGEEAPPAEPEAAPAT
ncbi:MAG TPA: discoidin domain-containing protein [Polyangia bacterium]|nr:discoidin domain-containing protein [Polyangia bacterium]